jgi:dTDP-4-amino-4,6-dideoxygalactose transaminase
MSDTSAIPLVDLHAQYASIKPEIDKAIRGIVDNTAFIKGKALTDLEAGFAAMLGVEAASVVGCANGTCSVTTALRAAGIQAGDEVILPSHTFFATVESVVHTGAIPVFADIRPSDYTLDPKAVRAAITPKTRAIVPVHIYGTPCDMSQIMAIAAEHGLKVVEDCAQSHLATWNGQATSTFGDAAGFSFYPGKNLGAYGDAGAIVVKDRATAAYIRSYVDHGRADKYLHSHIGDNLRMDGLQAAILGVKLPHLPEWSEKRRQVARIYDERLKAAGFKVIAPAAEAVPVCHVYIVEVKNRDAVQKALAAKGIATGVHYPVPCHAQPAMATVTHRVSGDLPVTTQIVERILSLPIYPELSPAQQAHILDAFLSVAEHP